MKKVFVFMVAAAMIAGCVMPAMATDKEVSFYGNVRMDTFWIDRDAKTNSMLTRDWGGSSVGWCGPGAATSGLYDETDVWWDLCQGCSRFGAKFKAGDVAANVEIRPNSNSYYRQWWGSWNFGAGTLVVGQTWSPTWHGISNSVYDGGDAAAYGEAGGSLRTPQVAVHFPFEVGTLKISFAEPGTDAVAGNLGIAAADFDTESLIPKVEASFDGKIGMVDFAVFGGYNSLEARDASTDDTMDIDGYYGGMMVHVPIGPAYFKGDVWMAQNPYEYGLFLPGNPFAAKAYGNSIEDVEALGYMALVGMKFTDMLAFEAGYGYTKIERDNPTYGTEDEDDKAFYYIQMPITLAKGVTVTPEIGKFDEKEHVVDGVTVDDGDAFYYGAYWRIDF